MSGLRVVITASSPAAPKAPPADLVPQLFAATMLVGVWHDVDEGDRRTLLQGPAQAGERYWLAWADIVASARRVDAHGYEWRIMQRNHLYEYCNELITLPECQVLWGSDIVLGVDTGGGDTGMRI